MTRKDLIFYLEGFEEEDQDGTMEVKFSYPSGDYWRTELAGKINDASEGYTKYSDYHRTDQIATEEEYEECLEDETTPKDKMVRKVILLS